MGAADDGGEERRGAVGCQHLVIICVPECVSKRQQEDDKGMCSGAEFLVSIGLRLCVLEQCVSVFLDLGVWVFAPVTGGAETAETH